MEIIKGSGMNKAVQKIICGGTDGLAAGLTRLIALIAGQRERKLIAEGIGLTNRLLTISFSDKIKNMCRQEKNIETVAFGLIALIKIRKGILKGKKPLFVQGSVLLVILGATLFGKIEPQITP